MAEAKKEVKSKLKFKPLNGAVIVKDVPVPEGKIIGAPLPEKRVAEVMAVDETQELWVKLGEKVLCDARMTEMIPIDGDKYGILHKSQCYGIVE